MVRHVHAPALALGFGLAFEHPSRVHAVLGDGGNVKIGRFDKTAGAGRALLLFRFGKLHLPAVDYLAHHPGLRLVVQRVERPRQIGLAVNSDHDVAVSGLAVVKAPRQKCSHSLFLLDKLDVDVAVFTECAVRSRRAHKLFRTAPRRRIGYADAGVRRRVLRVPVKGCRHRRKHRHHALDGLLKLLHLCRIARWR